MRPCLQRTKLSHLPGASRGSRGPGDLVVGLRSRTSPSRRVLVLGLARGVEAAAKLIVLLGRSTALDLGVARLAAVAACDTRP